MGYSPWGRKESDTTEHTHPSDSNSLSSLNSFFLFGEIGGWEYQMWHSHVVLFMLPTETPCLEGALYVEVA